jgi:hypothetical protein
MWHYFEKELCKVLKNLKTRSCWGNWVAPNPITAFLTRDSEDTQTQGRRPCGGKGRDWSSATAEQGLPEAQEAGRGRKDLPRILRGIAALLAP